MESRDPKKFTLKKVRRCFVYQKKFIGVDTFLNVRGGMTVIYIEKDVDTSSLDLPDTLAIEKDVTHDKEFISYFLAGEKETSMRDIKNLPTSALLK